MRSDPFVILGIQKGATQNEIYNAYKALRNRYEEERFLEGEAGADAARALQELDLAYADAIEHNHKLATLEDGEDKYAAIKRAVIDKDLNKAQVLLDSINYRDAEWHYYQSIVFYEKNWFVECKKQLQIALELEPQNEKYKKSLANLEAKLNRESAQSAQQQQQFEQSNRTYGAGAGRRSYGSTRSDSDACCNVCAGLLCADCCCECMGGDLIRCC